MMKRQRFKFMGIERKPSRQPPTALVLSLDTTTTEDTTYLFTSPHGHGHDKILQYSRIVREI